MSNILKHRPMTDDVRQMSQIFMSGNIVPPIWYKSIVNPNGKPNYVAVAILSDLVYWYRPKEVRDESGKVIGLCRKFEGDHLRRSYDDFNRVYGFSKKECQTAFKVLGSMQLAKPILKAYRTGNHVQPNTMFIVVFPKQIQKLNEGALLPGGNNGRCDLQVMGVVTSRSRPSLPPGHNVYTETTTESSSEKERERREAPKPLLSEEEIKDLDQSSFEKNQPPIPPAPLKKVSNQDAEEGLDEDDALTEETAAAAKAMRDAMESGGPIPPRRQPADSMNSEEGAPAVRPLSPPEVEEDESPPIVNIHSAFNLNALEVMNLHGEEAGESIHDRLKSFFEQYPAARQRVLDKSGLTGLSDDVWDEQLEEFCYHYADNISIKQQPTLHITTGKPSLRKWFIIYRKNYHHESFDSANGSNSGAGSGYHRGTSRGKGGGPANTRRRSTAREDTRVSRQSTIDRAKRRYQREQGGRQSE